MAQINPCTPEVDYRYGGRLHSWNFDGGQTGLPTYGLGEDKAAYLQFQVGHEIWWVNCNDNKADCKDMLGDIDEGRVPRRPPSAQVPPKKKEKSKMEKVFQDLISGRLSFGPKSQLPVRCAKGKEVARKLQQKYVKR